MKFGTWNVRSLYRIGSLKTVSRKLAKCKLDLVGVQEVKWGKGGTEPADDYTFLCGNVNANCHIGTGLYIHKGLGI
jgi:exonuclease III